MPRGPKKHLKRLNAPKHWMLGKMDGTWAPKPSPGPHKERECFPLILILRNRLKYALTAAEANAICMSKLVKVDGKVRSDLNFPTGFQDIVEMEKSGDQFRMLYDTKGRFVLHKVSDEEKAFKLCRVNKLDVTKKMTPYIVTHDARTIRYPDPLIKVNDTVKVDVATGKVLDFIKFDQGVTVMITKGRNTGRVGHITHIVKHPGSFDIVTIKDSTDTTFSTRKENVFVIGNEVPAITLPKGKGVKIGIVEERASRMKKQGGL